MYNQFTTTSRINFELLGDSIREIIYYQDPNFLLEHIINSDGESFNRIEDDINQSYDYKSGIFGHPPSIDKHLKEES